MINFYGVKKYKDKFCVYKCNHWLTEGKNLHYSDKYKEQMMFDNKTDAIKKANELNAILMKKHQEKIAKRKKNIDNIKKQLKNIFNKVKTKLKRILK